MTNAKSTKRALLASVISMLLCAAMLIGTTFAWFTDSVTTGRNTIQAGNLDVKLQYSTDGTNWYDVTETTNMFKDGALWEPGYTEVVYLKVVNAGSLALKYQFGINVVSKTIGYTADDKEIDLSNYIKFGVVDVSAAYEKRDDARDEVKDDAVPISAGYLSEEGNLEAGEKSGMIAMVVYMPEEVGNEANHGTGKTAPSIELGISLVATQYTSESDSFDEKYDENAAYPVLDAADLAAAIENGGIVTLASDVVVESEDTGDDYLVPEMTITQDTYLNLGGNTLSKTTSDDELTQTPCFFEVTDGTLTIENGTIDCELGYNNSYGINVNGENAAVVINSGNYYGAITAIQVEQGSLTINGGFFDLAPTCKDNAPQYAKYVVNCYDENFKAGTATITITGGTFVNFDPSDNPEKGNTSYVAEGYKVVSEKQESGETWYTVVPE